MTRTAPGRGARVLGDVPARQARQNPFTALLASAVNDAGPTEVVFFSWRRAIAGRYSVFHMHWPEYLFVHDHRGKRLIKQVLGLLFVLRLSIRGVPVVRTVHNGKAHIEVSPYSRFLLRRLEKRLVRSIYMNEIAPDGRRVAGDPDATVIPHGHYRDWYAKPLVKTSVSSAEPIVLAFGILRRYKNLESLIAAFAACTKGQLVIAGPAPDAEYLAELREAAAGLERVTFRTGYIADDELAGLISSAAVCVLPYRDFYNSGAALLALSLDRPVLVPRIEITEILAREMGEKWVVLYDGPLAGGDIKAALDRAKAMTHDSPDMSSREWAGIAKNHQTLYQDTVTCCTSGGRYPGSA